MNGPTSILILCAALCWGGSAPAQPAAGAPPADARRLMDDLLAETQPQLLRDAGALATRPNRVLIGRTRPRPSAIPGVCELDTFSISARPERERGSPVVFDTAAALIRGVESERLYQLASEKPPPRAFPPVLTPEKDCAALAGDPSLEFFAAPNPGMASVAGQFLAWLAEHPAELASARCPPGACPTRSAAAGLFRRAAIIAVRDHETCSRPRAGCYSVLLRDGDTFWSVDFRADFDTDGRGFGGVRFRRQANLVID
jgi:hypothetical protein